MLRKVGLKPGMKLYYYDSDGHLDEIVWEGKQIRFLPGPGRVKT